MPALRLAVTIQRQQEQTEQTEKEEAEDDRKCSRSWMSTIW